MKYFNYNHSNGCNPTTLEYQCCASHKGEYTSNIPNTVYWQLCNLMKDHPKKYAAPSSLAKYISNYHNVTKQGAFCTRIRCKRLMKKFKECSEFQNVEEMLNSNDKFLK